MAVISDIIYPSTAKYMDWITIEVHVVNNDELPHYIWCEVVDADTGEDVMEKRTAYALPGEELVQSTVVMMPNKDWHLEVRAGHGVEPDDVRSITIKLLSPAKLFGYVKNARTSEPVPGAKVSIPELNKSATTNSDGYYEITDIDPGAYEARCEADGYFPLTAIVKLDPGEEERFDWFLTPKPAEETGWLYGYVRDKETDTPLKEAQIYCAGRNAFTDESGYYKIENIPVGTYTVYAYYPGYKRGEKQITISANQGTRCDFELEKQATTGWLQGKVYDKSTNRPIAGATVMCAGLYSTTDSAGFYKIEGIPPGTYKATASKDGYYSSSATVTIKAGLGTKHDFYLEPVPEKPPAPPVPETGSVYGYVRDAVTKNPIPDATVFCYDKSVKTNENGYYKIEDIPVGTHTITAYKVGYYQYQGKVEVTKDGTRKDIELTPAGKPTPPAPPAEEFLSKYGKYIALGTAALLITGLIVYASERR